MSRGLPVRIPLILGLAAACLYLLAASSRDFWAPDEPDFAEHVREMIERKDPLVPYQNGKPYGEKPILLYWAVLATTPFSGGDVSPAATRLPSALAAGAMVFGAAFLAGFRGGRRESLMAGAATAVSPIVFWQGQFLQTDALFSALVLTLFLAQILVEEDAERSRLWLWVYHLALPLAVLTKGPLAIALSGAVALARSFLTRSARPITVLAPIRGAAIFVLLVTPWYVAASLSAGREYAYDLIVKQNWVRFTKAFDHIQPWWFYLESIWGDFFPWTLPALAAPIYLRRQGAFARRPELRFATVIVATTFVFLSMSQSKQGKYLLPAYPVAAVLLAAFTAQLESAAGRGLRVLRSYFVLIAALLLGAALALSPVARVRMPDYAFLAPFVVIPLALGAAGTLLILRRRRSEAAPALLAIAATLAAGEAATAAAVFPAIDPRKTGRAFYERVRAEVGKDEPLAYWGQTYRCYPILVMRRRTEHFWVERDLADWMSRTPGSRVLADQSERQHWTHPYLLDLEVEDRGRVGGDEALLLRRR